MIAVIGNIGRYLNHSCDPNLAMVTIRSNSMVPHLALFTSRTVQKVWNSVILKTEISTTHLHLG